MKKWVTYTLIIFLTMVLFACKESEKSLDTLIYDAKDSKTYQMEVTITENEVAEYFFIIRNKEIYKIVGSGQEFYVLADDDNEYMTGEIYMYSERLETYIKEFYQLPLGEVFDFLVYVFFEDFNMNWFVRDGDSLRRDENNQTLITPPYTSIYNNATSVHIYKEEQELYVDMVMEDGSEINMNVSFSDVAKISIPEEHLQIESELGYYYVKEDFKTHILSYVSNSVNITIPEMIGHGVVTSIGSRVIKYFTEEYIKIPATVTHIDGYAFSTINDEAKIIIPNNHRIEYIGNRAFNGFYIDYVLFDDETITIEKDAFTRGTVLFTHEREELDNVLLTQTSALNIIYGVDQVIEENGIAYYIKDGHAHVLRVMSHQNDIVIPALVSGYPVVSIGEFAFKGIHATSLTFDQGSVISRIHDEAFTDAQIGSDIHLPESVTRIGNRAFAYGIFGDFYIASSSLIIERDAFVNTTSDHIYFENIESISTFENPWNPTHIPYSFND